MSLVGPRPEQPALAQRYSLRAPAFAFRELVAPGITGWAQIRAGYAGDFAESEIKLEHDLFYMKHQSLLLDLVILARTAGITLLGQKGGR
jgi:lipopolysaccharide/colanic/teichoic acid biosynthesis glycosyltransferase